MLCARRPPFGFLADPGTLAGITAGLRRDHNQSRSSSAGRAAPGTQRAACLEVARLFKRLAASAHRTVTAASLRHRSCAVVGSSGSMLGAGRGAAIDAHDAVFRANMAVTEGYEEYAGRRTSVRIVNPVEDVFKARKRSEDGTEIIIKNQDPPIIRSPSEQHGRFLTQAEKEPDMPNYLGRRQALGTRMCTACACIRTLPQVLELRIFLPLSM